jgi:hypothetical protein
VAAKDHYNWPELYEQMRQAISEGVRPQWASLAAYLHLDPNSLRRGVAKVLGEIPKDLTDLPPIKTKTPIQKEEGNYLEIQSNAPAVYTLEQLLNACKVDLKKWQVKDYMVNQWQGFYGEGNVVPLYQVKAFLIRRQVEAISPVLRPVEMNLPHPRPLPKRVRLERGVKRVKRALIIADPQVGFRRRLYGEGFEPFHDRRVLDIALQIAEAETFDNISIIGDGADLSAFSLKYTPEPTFWHTTQPALLELAWWLGMLRMAQPDAEMDFYEGNHEVRPTTAIISHMREAYQLRAVDELHLPPALSIPRLLSLHTLKVNYIEGYPDNWKWLNERTMIRHGDVVRSTPGGTAAAVVNKTTYTTIFGHIHRRELVARNIQTAQGHAIQTAFCPGCACHIDGRVPGSKADDQWQQGLAVIEYMETGEPQIIPIAVDRGRAVYAGREWKARDRDKELDGMLKTKLEEMLK